MLEPDPDDGRDVIVEIRAGAGGDEAALFAGDIYHMLTSYADLHGYKHGDARRVAVRRRRLQVGHLRGARRGRLLAAEVGVGRASRAARAGDRGAGPHPHVDGVGGGAAGGRGRRGAHRSEGSEDRRLSLDGPRRTGREHDRLGRAHDAPADRASSSPARTSARRSRTASGRCGSCAPGCTSVRSRSAGRPRTRRAGRRSARAIAPRRSARTTSRRTRVTDHRIKHTSHALDAVLAGQLDEFTEALRVADRGNRLGGKAERDAPDGARARRPGGRMARRTGACRSPRLDADRHARARPRAPAPRPVPRPRAPADPRRRSTRFRELLRRRGRREPLAYVLGSWSFRGLELAVDARVLVPRPETEWLVERCARAHPRDVPAPRVLDVGTGSGAIAISIAVARPDAVVTATDVSEDALAARARERRRARRHDRLAPGRPARARLRRELRARGREPAVCRRGRCRRPGGLGVRAGARGVRRPTDGRALIDRLIDERRVRARARRHRRARARRRAGAMGDRAPGRRRARAARSPSPTSPESSGSSFAERASLLELHRVRRSSPCPLVLLAAVLVPTAAGRGAAGVAPRRDHRHRPRAQPG